MKVADDARLIDRWFPVAAVDEACGTPTGSGLTEKAMFTWFASRPLAQARAAALTSMLPPEDQLKSLIDTAVRHGTPDVMNQLAGRVHNVYGNRPPVILDMFSGRGIIPLEAARAGANAIGIDLSPVATLAGRLLGDFPARDWSGEPEIPFSSRADRTLLPGPRGNQRLADDVEDLLAEIDRRVAARVEAFFPKNQHGVFPWGYVWVVTLPCDQCKRHFPLLGSLGLRLPNPKGHDPGQSMRLNTANGEWSAEVIDGVPTQQPPYQAGLKADGKKKKGKSARCLFCGQIHALETVKAKCANEEARDRLLLVADTDHNGTRFFRVPTEAEIAVSHLEYSTPGYGWPYAAVPDEVVSSGNVHTIMASGYGYHTFGRIMVARQARVFVESVQVIRELFSELLSAGLSRPYASALACYAASNLCRKLRRSTRGAVIDLLRAGVRDMFTNEAKVNFSFDFFEAGPGAGAGTWASVSKSSVRALRKVLEEQRGAPARFQRASATALPLRDQSVDVVITDPPYYDMVEYADASDVFFVWLKRTLYDIEPDLFGPDRQESDGLQDKNAEIIVRRVHEPNRVRHDTVFYEAMLAKAFAEARRVLKGDGHLVVMFGHSDPDAWRRLLGALQTAGFVVTSAWPSRTESANTGVASIKVTITIGCRVAEAKRPSGIGFEVDREVVEAVTDRVRQWDTDGLALEDQLMASYGPAMEVYGRYSRVINPDGTDADLDHYLAIARKAVRDAMRLRVDQLPLETFDAITRFAIFWLRAKGRDEVPKGEARFFAQADELRLDELRERILVESKGGFALSLSAGPPVTVSSSTFEVARAMAHAWDAGGMAAVAELIALAGLEPSNQHLWAVVAELATQLPASDKVANALAGIKRSSSLIGMLVVNHRSAAVQRNLFEKVEI